MKTQENHKNKAIILFDSLSRSNRALTLKDEEKLGIYVCGPTVYDHCHLGHGRCFLVFDSLVRMLKSKGEVTFCRNITDIDDKILRKAEALGISRQQVAETFIKSMHQDFALLNMLEPDFEPRVSQHIPEIINYIKRLGKKGLTYQVEDGLCYDTSKINYDFFQKPDLSQQRSRITKDLQKKSPQDFYLWKRNEGGYASPWGVGYPGWHIECSAMSEKYLGKTFHIHGGGEDLKYPHHQNEIAQSIGCNGCQPAQIWVHSAMVNISGEKMSKSLGNARYLRDIVKNKFQGDALRHFLLSHHNRSVIDFSFDKFEESKKQIRLWKSYYEKHKNLSPQPVDLGDMNTALLLHKINSCIKQKSWGEFIYLVKLLGFSMEKTAITPKIQQKILRMREAKAEKNYGLSDELRGELMDLGVSCEA
jgi:cysteinyl-tRNA synthetase